MSEYEAGLAIGKALAGGLLGELLPAQDDESKADRRGLERLRALAARQELAGLGPATSGGVVADPADPGLMLSMPQGTRPVHFTPADQLEMDLLLAGGKITPEQQARAAAARQAMQMQQQAFDALPDPYSRANLAGGRTVAAPFQAGAYGVSNRYTGDVAYSPTQLARAADYQAQTAQRFAPDYRVQGGYVIDQRSGAFMPTPSAAAGVAAEQAQTQQRLAGVTANEALARQRTRETALVDGRLVLVERNPQTGAMEIVRGPDGEPLGPGSPQSSQYQKPEDPAERWRELFDQFAAPGFQSGRPTDPAGLIEWATQQANQRFAAMYPGQQPQLGPAAGAGAAPMVQPQAAGAAAQSWEWGGQTFSLGQILTAPDGRRARVIGRTPDGEPRLDAL